MTARTAGLALAILAVSTVSAPGADVELRWKFRKDQPYHYVLTQGTEISMKVANNNLSTKMSQVSDMTWNVKAVRPDGSAEMTQTIDRMQIKVEGPTGSFEVDSKQKPEAAQAAPVESMRKLITGIVGVPIDFVMSARGEMVSVNVPAKFIEAMNSAGPAGQAFAGAFSEKGLKQLIEQSSVLLPEKPVAPGTTWVQKRSVESPMLGNMDIETTYTDKGETAGKPDLHKIDGAVKIQFRQPDNAQLSVKVTSQDNSANYLFNTISGHLSRSDVKQKMQMEISAQGQSFTQDLTSTVSMILSGDPATK
jgi:hypothetical protein